MLESVQKAHIGRGLVCTAANAVVVLGSMKGPLPIIKIGDKAIVWKMKA